MEWSDIVIRETEASGFEAELRGDKLINGDNGCWISIVGWGETADHARANLQSAIAAFKAKPPEA